MSDNTKDKSGTPVPTRRLSRLAGLGGVAANVAGGVAIQGVRQMASGKRPKISDLLLTPKNAQKLTHQLSNMRGAAMKIGQMISMDSGDFLPKEFADILARLRADAQHMPRSQLMRVLTQEWGDDWQAQFSEFEYKPVAAASIGQVQRARLPNGDTLAIKVQYPGVKDSIDSDVNNVASLLRISGLIPGNLDVKPIIEEGRRQLHQEADYEREAEYLNRFRNVLRDDKNFQVPNHYKTLSTDKILAMSYIESRPIEYMLDAPQETRDRISALLIELTLREIFVFNIMQTDPNFANYGYNLENGKLVLLDFGASCDIEKGLVAAYKNMFSAIVRGTQQDIIENAIQIGFIPADMPVKYLTDILEIIDLAIQPLCQDKIFDFGANEVAAQIRDKSMPLASQRELWHLPPAETVFIQRKIGGVYLLATRLGARVNIHSLLQKYLAN
ncbi:MAG: AarF/ABC1/UbiB kinase family protein [Acidimicrobiales bacterium]|nr:AarF/ABC1/UbiB kinase family protein [Hyphomonadaceae bacterium]RZV41401.1 MAG: AarF/ABC1/UbiB kinase family protein [Acidimicrobiales bacterium]